MKVNFINHWKPLKNCITFSIFNCWWGDISNDTWFGFKWIFGFVVCNFGLEFYEMER